MQRPLAAIALFLLASGCIREGSAPAPSTLDADVPLHLEEHVAQARIEGSAVPKELPKAVEWKLDRPQAVWKALVPLIPWSAPASVSQADGALRVALTDANRRRRTFTGGIMTELPGWNREDWAFLIV